MPAYDRRIVEALYWNGTDTYGRAWFGDGVLFRKRCDKLLELGVTGRVLVVGCGFGFLIEHLLDSGVDAWGCEPGPYFWDRDLEWRHDVRSRVTPVKVEDLWTGGFDWVVDEDAAPAADNVPGFLEACRSRGNRVVHFVTAASPGGRDSSHTWLTLNEWRALAPEDVWIANGAL